MYVSMQNTYLLKDCVPTYLLMCGFVGSFYLLTGYETWGFLIFQLFSVTITAGNIDVDFLAFFFFLNES